MNLNLTVEDFIKAIEEAEKIIPKRLDITIKNAKVAGVKLNSEMIDSIPKAEGTAPYIYDGLKVYQDDSVKKPQFIVEGEIETKKYLKWEDLEFAEKDKEIFALLNETKYVLNCYKHCVGYEYITISSNGIVVADLCSVYKADKQFFNNLRLERVE